MSLTKATYSMIEGAPVNVLDYGAVGDGVANDTAAIQAAVSASSLVFIPADKIFRVTAKVTVPSDVTIYGAGAILIDQSPYIGGIALGDNCTVDGVTFYGNGTQTAFGAISGGQRGAAILGYDVSNVRVLNCKFYDFLGNGLNVAAGIVQFGYSNNCRISGCYFDNSNYGFSDIDASYLAGDCIYDANISYSNSDIFIGIASVGTATNIAGTEVSVAAHHIISNNIHIKNRWATPPVGQVLGRHGIASHYDGGRDYMTMTGNIIGHVSRHGVYLRGPDASMSVVTGPDTITGNYFLYCGNASGDVSNYYSGIRAENTIPTIIQGNYFYKSGYFPDGSAGVGPAYDIECVRGTNDLTAVNNMLLDGLSGSIVLSQSVTNRTINRVNIANNNIRNSAVGIVLDASGAGSVINDCKIIGNFITLTGATFGGNRAAGIAVEFGSGTASFAYSWLISSNTVIGTGKTNNQYGVTVQLSGSDFTKKCTVQDNSFRSLEEGFASRRFLTNSIDYPSHRTLGVFTRVAGNKFVSCGSGVYIEKNNGNDLAFIEPTNQFDDCTSTGVIQTIDNGGVVVGVVSGFDASGNALVEIQSDTAPAFLSYYRGEKVIDLTPSAGGSIGSVCTTSGSPGTWKTFGAISA